MKAVALFLVVSAVLLVAAIACQQGSPKQGSYIIGALLVLNCGMIWHVARGR